MYDFYNKQWVATGLPKKLLLIMKLTTFILLTVILQVSASSFAQKITLSEKNATLSALLKEIRTQSGYDFFYKTETLKAAKPVSITVKNAELKEVLEQIFENQPLEYTVKGETVTIERKTPSFLDKAKSVILNLVQDLDVRGIVVDGETGNALSGASVKVKGTNRVTNTGSDGVFYLKGVDEDAVIEISFIGYMSQELKAKKDLGEIRLVMTIGALQEVTINKGYYRIKQELNTGSIGTLKAADISKQPISDPLMALQGRIPGLYITQTTGVPGAGLKVNLRGKNSIKNGTDPLYIIDEVPFDSKQLDQNPNAGSVSNVGLSPFHSIRPEDIESIEILKDADATAIYGSRGSNGVILITTKKGRSGKTAVDINAYSGFSKITNGIAMMNSQEFIEMRQEAFKNDNASPGTLDYDLNGTWDKNRYTDWTKLLIGNTARTTNINASLSGGNLQTQFLLGAGYRKETTVYAGNYENEIGSTNFNLHHNSENGKFKADFTFSYSINNNILPTADLTKNIVLAPNTPELYDSNGELNFQNGTFDNPLKLLNQKSTSTAKNMLSNVTLSYNLLKSLQLKSGFGYNTMTMDEVNKLPLTSFNPYTVNPTTARTLILGKNQRQTWIIEPQLNYSMTAGSHTFESLIGVTFQKSMQEGIKQTGTGFSNDNLIDNITAAPSVSNSINFTKYKYNAIFARIGYNFKEKYIVNLTGRRDGSSRFGPGKQFGNFGAIGAAWLFSKEDFIKKIIPSLTFGKLRGSFGRTGNDKLTDYEFLSTYTSNSAVYLGGTTLGPLGLTNPFYGWENLNKNELGIDLGFINNRLLLGISAFKNRTSNQLVGYSLPFVTGYNTITANIPAVVENKGLEFEFNSANIQKNNFSWSSSFNISFPKDKLVAYPNIEGSSYNSSLKIGQSQFIRFVYYFDGLDQETGLFKFRDVNGDGAFNDLDKYPVFVGQKFFGGISNTLSYKGVSLDFFFQFVKQTGYSSAFNVSPGTFLEGGYNQPSLLLDRWKNANETGAFQKYSTKFAEVFTGNTRYGGSDAIVTDASFVRLKNFQLSWQIPQEWQSKLKLQSLRFYLQAQNLFTLTNFKGADPESPQYGVTNTLPPLKTFTAGIQFRL